MTPTTFLLLLVFGGLAGYCCRSYGSKRVIWTLNLYAPFIADAVQTRLRYPQYAVLFSGGKEVIVDDESAVHSTRRLLR